MPLILPPTITAIGPQSTMKILLLGPIAFTIGDAETQPSGLTLSGTSSNATLVPNANITFGGGTGADRNVVITPVAGESGTTTITITVSDGTLNASTNFVLTVNAANTAPTITAIGPQSTNENTPTGANCIYHRRCRNSAEWINTFSYFFKCDISSKC